jgi:DNA-binding SARP family transcriptional activator
LDTNSRLTNQDPPEKSDSDQVRWRAIDDLLDAQQYVQTIEHMREAEISFLERGDTHAASMLAAAKQLCLICQQVQVEKRRYDHAAAEASSREGEFRRQLRSLIYSLSGYPAVHVSEQLETPLIPATAEAEARPSLRQRLAEWLASLSQGGEAVIPDTVSETAETETQQFERQITRHHISPETISPPTEPEPYAKLVDEESDELVLASDEHYPAVAEPPAEKESSAISPPGSHKKEKGEETKIFLAASDRELLEGIHELLLTTSQSLTDSHGKEVEEEDDLSTQPAQLEKEPMSRPQLAQQATQKLDMETADRVPVIARDLPRPGVPFLMVYTLGRFRVIQNDQPIDDWHGSKGKSIFKYLISRREQSVAKEVLMELFWPGADPDAARNNLNVVIYGLRKALRNNHVEFSHILFQEDRYLLNPEMQIWLDFEAFLELFQEAREAERSGHPELAMQLYQAAELLYQGEFLAEDRYEDWLIHQRQNLRDKYMSLLDRLSRYYFDAGAYSMCVTCLRQMLAVDSCHEDAHRRLIRFFYRRGQIHLALRQYHQCVEALKEELDIVPAAETTQLVEKMRQNRPL